MTPYRDELIRAAKERRARFDSIKPPKPQTSPTPPNPCRYRTYLKFKPLNWPWTRGDRVFAPPEHWKHIVGEVSEFFRVPVDQICGPHRYKHIVLARQVAMWRLCYETGMSLPQVGLKLGGKDHTTVLHARNKIDRLVASGEMVLPW